MPQHIFSEARRAQFDAERTIPLRVYQEHGYDTRSEYLEQLAQQHGAEVVESMLSVLPPEEDFDGLACELEDLHAMNLFD